MTMAPALVILAAAVCRRFGSDEQIAGVGPRGEWLLEYADLSGFLPHAIDRHLARSGQRLAVLRDEDEWLGLTYPENRPRVAKRLAALRDAEVYPKPRWSSA